MGWLELALRDPNPRPHFHSGKNIFLLGPPYAEVFIHESLRATNTENPLYTDTRYNDKIRYNDNLAVMKPSLIIYSQIMQENSI